MSTRPPYRRILGLLLPAAGALWATGGCASSPLFPKDAPRTQFEMYDRMHGRSAPVEEPDVFGNARPALRERLTRK